MTRLTTRLTIRLTTRFFGIAATVFALSLVAPTSASAQEQDRCSEEQEKESTSGKNYKTIIVNGRKIFVIERAFVVCGKVPRPQVIYVLQQRNINYEWETLKRNFLPKILESVTKAPF